MNWHIASVSWGKDSLAMLLLLIAKNYPLDEVLFYDTGMEFQAIYSTRDQMLPQLHQMGIKYTELKPRNPFLFDMLERPVESRQKGKHLGYGWCGGLCRWGTTEKQKAMDGYAEERNAVVYVGIAADEAKRLAKEKKPYKRHPLAEWGITEAAALAHCYGNGFFWLENETRLYDVLDRVSCWCCCNKNMRELRNMHQYLPEYWARLKELQAKIERPMKGFYKGEPRGVFELEKRFDKEREANPDGGCVALWTIDPETMEPDAPTEIFGDWQAAEYLAAVLEKLRPTRPVNVPDLAGIIRAAYKSGVDICDHCQDFRCNTCVVNDWKEDPDDE